MLALGPHFVVPQPPGRQEGKEGLLMSQCTLETDMKTTQGDTSKLSGSD